LILQYARPNGSSLFRMLATIESRRAESTDAFIPRVTAFSADVKLRRGTMLSAVARSSSNEAGSHGERVGRWLLFVALEEPRVFAFMRLHPL
jgi:hypothetical protein